MDHSLTPDSPHAVPLTPEQQRVLDLTGWLMDPLQALRHCQQRAALVAQQRTHAHRSN